MKKIKRIYRLLFVFGLVSLTASGQHIESTFRFSDVRLEREPDSLRIEMDITVPKGTLSGCRQWLLTPRLQTENRSQRLPQITLSDKKRARLDYRSRVLSEKNRAFPASFYYEIERKKEKKIRYQVTVAHEEEIEDGIFTLEGVLTSCGGGRRPFRP